MVGIQSLSTTTLYTNNCGYNSVEDLKNCMRLSALLLKKSTPKVIFFTDALGAELVKPFADIYDDIIVCLDQLDWVEPHNWAFSKLLCYTYIKEPFVHVDNDVFLWDCLPKHLFDASKVDAFFQGIEPFEHYPFYTEMLGEVQSILPKPVKQTYHQFAYNCGVAGFNDISIIPEYYELAKNYIKANQEFTWLKDKNKLGQTLIFEQSFITHLCKDKTVDFLLHSDTTPKYPIRYTHLLSTSKQNKTHMLQVKRKLNNLLALEGVL